VPIILHRYHVEPPVVTNYRSIVCCLILCGCTSVPAIKVRPENAPYIVINLLLDKVERLAEPGSKGFPPIKKEILRVGRLKLYTSFRMSVDRERQVDEDQTVTQYKSPNTFDANTKFRIDKDVVYIEFVLKW